MKMRSRDSIGNEVLIGSTIKVLRIDERITKFLPADEVADLNSFVGNILPVIKINSDGSMIVSKNWKGQEPGEIYGHDVAIFPKGALLVDTA